MEIRRTGFAGPRRIFAEVSLPSGSKNSFLTDLPPGSIEDATGKSARGWHWRGKNSPANRFTHSCVNLAIMENMVDILPERWYNQPKLRQQLPGMMQRG